jgi:DNA-binding response OmpR family regulator
VVLVVNPEPGIADAVSEILSRNGYAAIPAYDAEDALETALLIPPELVVASIGSPGTGGVEVATVLKAKLPDCEVLLLSGQAGKAHFPAFQNLSAHEFAGIGTAVYPTDLLAQVSAHLKSQ